MFCYALGLSPVRCHVALINGNYRPYLEINIVDYLLFRERVSPHKEEKVFDLTLHGETPHTKHID